MKAALFDLDGVVFNTEPQYTIFWGEQCREFHPEHPGLEHEIKGQTLVQIYDKYFSGALMDKRAVITERLNEYELHMNYDYIPGFEDFITSLRTNGVKTAVVTSSNQAKMNVVYHRKPSFLSLFDAILTSEDFQRSKPDPDCYQKASVRLDAEPDECIVFEDSFNGLKSGRAARMAVVGLATTNTPEAIKPYSDAVICNYIGQNYEKMTQILAQFNKKQ
jgi:beta-phosphoglucomutase